MSDESQRFDPYEAVIADLKLKREQIDKTIQALESVRGGPVSGGSASIDAAPSTAPNSIGPGAFLGMSIPEAAKMLLRIRRQPLSNPEIVAGFKAGGFILGSKDPVNTVGAVLTRRANEAGDIVKVGRGTFGLKEWYPGRSFAKKERADPGDKGATPESEGKSTDEPLEEAPQVLQTVTIQPTVRSIPPHLRRRAELLRAKPPGGTSGS
jgi:hypothetical protein